MRLKPSQLQRYAEHFSLAGCIFLIGENCGALRRPWTLVFDDRTNLIDSFTCFLCQFSIFRVCRCSLVFIWRWNLPGAYCTWQMIHAVLVCCANFQFSVFVAVHWYSFGVGISLVPTVRDRWYMQYWYVYLFCIMRYDNDTAYDIIWIYIVWTCLNFWTAYA